MYLFASDYDGTLKQKHFVSRKTLVAIRRFRKRKHKFGIVTGRNLSMMLPGILLNQLPLDFLIGANGSIIKVKNEVIQCSYMDFEIAKQILQLAEQKKIGTIGISNGYSYGNRKVKPSWTVKGIVRYLVFLTQRLNSWGILRKKQISAIYLHDREEKIANLYEQIRKMDGIEAYVNNKEYLDIVPACVSKASGIAVLAKYYGTTEIRVIGDSLNDLSMIEAYQGYCVENACEELKQKASLCFQNVEEALTYVMEEEENETNSQ